MGGRRWTGEDVIVGLQTLSREGWAPTASEMGASMTNACIRYFGNLGAAAEAAGLRGNRTGPRPAHLRKAKVPEPAPKPTRKPGPTPLQRLLARERKASEARRLKRMAAEPKHVPSPVSEKRFGPMIPKWDDFVPPFDLNTSQRRVR